MLVPAVVLGICTSIGNSFITSSVGYLTEATDSASTFYKVLLCLYLMSAVASYLQQQADAHFDTQFDARHVYAFRIFLPILLMAFILMGLAELLDYASAEKVMSWSTLAGVLVLVSLSGFFAGVLSGAGAVIVGSVKKEHLVLPWLGFAVSGLLCIIAVKMVGFSPNASNTSVRHFFLTAAVLCLVCLAVLVFWHVQGYLDEAYEKAVSARDHVDDELEPVLGGTAGAANEEEPKVIHWAPLVQGVNVFMTVFSFPLLPLLCSSDLAQELVLWKFGMDFAGPLFLLLIPRTWPLACVVALVVVRAGLLIAVLYRLNLEENHAYENSSEHWKLIGTWDLLMFLGACVGPLCDTCSNNCLDAESSGAVSGIKMRLRLHKNRFAHHIGIVVGLTTSGTVMYMMHGELRPKRLELFSARSVLANCPRCAEADEALGSVRNFPCGGRTSDDVPSVMLFHYGANMGCQKLSAIDVHPQSAQAAYVPGWCLMFGDADNVPTSEKEPGFGNLVPCQHGCVHGVLHKISEKELPKIDATEPGYALRELGEVIGYGGQRYSGVKAYVMSKSFRPKSPSRRYAGLLYCTAKQELAQGYAAQMSCELEQLNHKDLACKSEKFLPLAAKNRTSSSL